MSKIKSKKTALITTKSPDNKDIKMQVPLNVVKEGNLKAGDKVTLEKTQEGTGAYLKKEGKVLAHMVNQDDAGLSSNQTVPGQMKRFAFALWPQRNLAQRLCRQC
ncbi:membrane protein [Salmonella enterica subsp. enterica serovar Madelia]|nr:membrane protein [Salmonella enterica subsp. enterica serovar Madelia]